MTKISIIGAMIAVMILLAAPMATADSNNDLTLKISNPLGDKYANKIIPGDTNTLEVWIANDATILGASWAFELDFTCDHSWEMNPEQKDSLPVVGEHNRGVGAFNMPALLIKCNFGRGKVDSLMLGGAVMNAGLAPGKSELTYTLRFVVPKDVKAQKAGLCIHPIFFPPAGTWTATGENGGYAPTFNGQPTLSEAEPRAKAACFDIVRPD
jgi:hypothetical protein